MNKLIYDKKSREVMLQGINEFADVVASTMGAKGRNVILNQEEGAPMVVNDGVTIAKEINFEDPVKDAGVQLLKHAAIQTNELAGDGTTTATVLARAIVRQGWDLVEKGANPVILRKELEAARKSVEDYLVKKAKTIDVNKKSDKRKCVQIASISVQDEELGKLIGELMFELGKNSAVSVKRNALEIGVQVDKAPGMRLEGQIMNGCVDNPDRWESKFEKPHVLILKDSPEDVHLEEKWFPLIRQFVVDGKKNVSELIIVAEKLSRRFIATMSNPANAKMVKWVWFRPTTAMKNMKEIYKDLNSVVGGDIVDEENGIFLKQMDFKQIGQVGETVCTRHEMVITVSDERAKSNKYLDRCSEVLGQIQNAEDKEEQKQIEERYANLIGGVAVIKAAAATERDTQELIFRIEDAVNATKSAMKEGVVAGGGIALLEASERLKDTDGEKVLKEALKAPVKQIIENAGYENLDKQIGKLKKGEGFNVLEHSIVNMEKHGIIDPVKVTRLALNNAVSVAGLLLTSEFMVVPDENDLDKFKTILYG